MTKTDSESGQQWKVIKGPDISQSQSVSYRSFNVNVRITHSKSHTQTAHIQIWLPSKECIHISILGIKLHGYKYKIGICVKYF